VWPKWSYEMDFWNIFLGGMLSKRNIGLSVDVENEIIKVDFVDPFDEGGVDWLLVRHVVSRTRSRVLHVLVLSFQIFLNRPDPLFEPLFRYIRGI